MTFKDIARRSGKGCGHRPSVGIAGVGRPIRRSFPLVAVYPDATRFRRRQLDTNLSTTSSGARSEPRCKMRPPTVYRICADQIAQTDVGGWHALHRDDVLIPARLSAGSRTLPPRMLIGPR